MSPTPLPHATFPVVGQLVVPGSKSETNRALVLAALASGPSRLQGALASRDSALMVAALKQFGVGVRLDADVLHITAPKQLRGGARIDCGLAGTVMRFVPPLALLADGPSQFFGDAHASNRPMAALLCALHDLGAQVSAQQLPFTLSPPELPSNREIQLDASLSSQFVSGLLLVGARLPHGLRLRHVGQRLPSRPHIEMTVAMLRSRGVVVAEPDEYTWVVSPGSIASGSFTIEPDLTNAAVFLAAALATGGRVSVPGWPDNSLQPGELFVQIAQQMGGTISRVGDVLTVAGPPQLRGIDIDLASASELTPVVAALGALAEGTTTIRGVAHIRGHETDRLAALAAELGAAGAEVTQYDDGLQIRGGQLRPALLKAYADHRMVHAAAIVALRTPGTQIDDIAATSKTMPGFEHDWLKLVGQ